MLDAGISFWIGKMSSAAGIAAILLFIGGTGSAAPPEAGEVRLPKKGVEDAIAKMKKWP